MFAHFSLALEFWSFWIFQYFLNLSKQLYYPFITKLGVGFYSLIIHPFDISPRNSDVDSDEAVATLVME